MNFIQNVTAIYIADKVESITDYMDDIRQTRADRQWGYSRIYVNEAYIDEFERLEKYLAKLMKYRIRLGRISLSANPKDNNTILLVKYMKKLDTIIEKWSKIISADREFIKCNN